MSEPETTIERRRRAVGVLDIPAALLAPQRLFARVEDVPTYAWPLVVLLAGVTLIGYATVQTGLIDREVDDRVAQRIAHIEDTQRNVVERSELRELYEQQRKQGEFEKLLARIGAIVAQPASALAAALLTSAVLFGLVALSGRKPEWNTLMNVCVFAGFAEALRLVTVLALNLRDGALSVDTSLALVLREWELPAGMDPAGWAALGGALTAFDPFRIWRWLVVIIGVQRTAQLPGWRAWVVGGVGWLAGAGLRAAAAAAMAQTPASA